MSAAGYAPLGQAFSWLLSAWFGAYRIAPGEIAAPNTRQPRLFRKDFDIAKYVGDTPRDTRWDTPKDTKWDTAWVTKSGSKNKRRHTKWDTSRDTPRDTISVLEASFRGCLVSGFYGCGEKYA